MRKNIKYSASFIIIVLSMFLGYTTQAEEIEKKEMERTGIRNEFREVKNEIENIKIENKENREEFKKEAGSIRENLKNEIETKREEFKNKVESIKENRELFKKEIETKREEVKIKIEGMKATFKEGLNKIKDEAKKISTEKIANTVELLNTKFTNKFLERIDQIENVMVSIESRISKAENRGVDVANTRIELEKAKTAISEARTAISLQSSKVYEINITTEATLKAEMKRVRNLFVVDIKALNEKVKAVHASVRNIATTLAKIPKIDDEAITENENKEVEENNTNNNQ